MSPSALVLCLLVAACSAGPPPRLCALRSELPNRIVGGEPVDISEFPWQISLQDYGHHRCGGSIISSTWVLTAAHCLVGVTPDVLSVRAGTSYRDSGGTVYSVATTIEHKDFDRNTKDYDCGLVEISEQIVFGSNVQAVYLGSFEIAVGTNVTVTGWGDTMVGGQDFPMQLRAVSTSIIDRGTCNSAYKDRRPITERMICAGEKEGGKDACQGDSGGPLVAGNTQYGIVSWGYGCARACYPGVYANVPALRSWITEKTGL